MGRPRNVIEGEPTAAATDTEQPRKKDITVVDRRLQSGNVFRRGSRKIPSNPPGKWEFHEANSQISDQHIYEYRNEKGWDYATSADLDCTPDDVGYREMDGRLVKGDKGHLVLMKMLVPKWEQVVALKDRTNRENTFSKAKTKNDILAAAGAELGDEGASFLARNVNKIQITDSRERVALDE